MEKYPWHSNFQPPARLQRNTHTYHSKPHHVRPLQTHVPSLRWPPLVFLSLPTHTNPIDPSRKIPWRLSTPQKRRQRKRLRLVDNVIAVVDTALQKQNLGTTKNLERWKEEMPTEQEMRPKDKYTMFDRKEKNYRKGVHSEFRVDFCGMNRWGEMGADGLFYRASEMDEG